MKVFFLKVEDGKHRKRGRPVRNKTSHHASEGAHAWPHRAGGEICHCFGKLVITSFFLSCQEKLFGPAQDCGSLLKLSHGPIWSKLGSIIDLITRDVWSIMIHRSVNEPTCAVPPLILCMLPPSLSLYPPSAVLLSPLKSEQLGFRLKWQTERSMVGQIQRGGGFDCTHLAARPSG